MIIETAETSVNQESSNWITMQALHVVELLLKQRGVDTNDAAQVHKGLLALRQEVEKHEV